MEQLIKNLIDHLAECRLQEYEKIEKFKKDESKDLILITSGKIIEMDLIIQYLHEMLEFNSRIKSIHL
jgi:hypothetical protein